MTNTNQNEQVQSENAANDADVGPEPAVMEPANPLRDRATIKWRNEPFIWIIAACISILLFQMLFLTGFTFYMFAQIDFAAERGVAIRLTQIGLAMCFGFIFVLLAAFWAWYDVKSQDRLGFSGENISGKAVGISAILAACGTVIILAVVLKNCEFDEANHHSSPTVPAEAPGTESEPYIPSCGIFNLNERRLKAEVFCREKTSSDDLRCAT